jgi:soluble cytochrome b562
MSPAFLATVLTCAAALATVNAEAADNSLKDLMKKVNAQVLNGDAKSLAPLFEQAKAKAKPEFKDWNSMLDKAKAAAEKGDMDAVKASCKGCHDQYRKDYKEKYGSKAP